MNKEYVQEYVDLEKHHWWFIVRQHILSSFLKKHIPQNALRVLNIGAAGGASSRWLSAFGEVVSLESDSFFVDHLLRQKMEVVKASILDMPFPGESFDLVCAFDVVEHVQDHSAAMKEVERVCKTGGHICITVPSFEMLWSQHDVVNGHYRRYSQNSLLELSKKFPSLQLLELKYFNSLLFVPILVARKCAKIFGLNKNKAGSDFTRFKTGSLSNTVLKKIFSLEVALLNKVSFPVGVSLFGIWKKTEVGKPKATGTTST